MSVDLQLAGKQMENTLSFCVISLWEDTVASSALVSDAVKFREEDLNTISTSFLPEGTCLIAHFIKHWIPTSLNSHSGLGFEVVLLGFFFLIELTSMDTYFFPSAAPQWGVLRKFNCLQTVAVSALRFHCQCALWRSRLRNLEQSYKPTVPSAAADSHLCCATTCWTTVSSLVRTISGTFLIGPMTFYLKLHVSRPVQVLMLISGVPDCTEQNRLNPVACVNITEVKICKLM